jgi:putative glycosyltransferase (TIGR04372 family)
MRSNIFKYSSVLIKIIFIDIFQFIFLLVKLYIEKGKKEIELVYLFNSKFGHFYLNTEVYLRENLNKNKYIIFFPKTRGIIDTYELKDIWERKIDIYSWEVGRLFIFLNKFFYFNVVLDIPTFPKNNLEFIKEPVFIKLLNNPKPYLEQLYYNSKTEKHICFSVRDSSYQNTNQQYNSQSWRNLHINSFTSTVKYLIQENFLVVLSNRGVLPSLKIKNDKYFDYSKSSCQSLEKELALILNCYLYIGSSTGCDIIPLTNNIQVLLINTTLGVSFQTIYFNRLTIIIPQKLYSTKFDRFLTLSEYLKLLSKVENEFNIDRFELFHQSQFGVLPIPPSEDEILEGVKESLLLKENQLFMNDEDKNNQKLFWDIYPKEYPLDNDINDRKAHKSPHLAIISPYFLRKNGYFII